MLMVAFLITETNLLLQLKKIIKTPLTKVKNGVGQLTLHLLQNQVLQMIQLIQILMENGFVPDLPQKQLFMMSGIKLLMVN